MHIDLHKPILEKNDALAAELRQRFAENHVYVVDLLASPGSGKTSTILATIDALRDEFNIAVDEWEKEFNQKAQQFLINTELSSAQVTGAFANGTPTLAAKEQMREQMAQLGQTMIELGITPTAAQIEAMGLTNEQYQEYAKKMKKSGGGGGSSGNTLGWAGNIKYEWLHPESKVSDAVTATSSAAAGGTTDYVAALNAASS
jgi:hypothetical protein